jgi:Alg9-like mannosyltransferase family
MSANEPSSVRLRKLSKPNTEQTRISPAPQVFRPAPASSQNFVPTHRLSRKTSAIDPSSAAPSLGFAVVCLSLSVSLSLFLSFSSSLCNLSLVLCLLSLSLPLALLVYPFALVLKRTRSLSVLLLFLVLLVKASFLAVRFFSALFNNAGDCDETFNFWEPSHYLLYGFGFQTWEYSPEYSLRSYFYVGLHSAIGYVLWPFFGYNKVCCVCLCVCVCVCLSCLFVCLCSLCNGGDLCSGLRL